MPWSAWSQREIVTESGFTPLIFAAQSGDVKSVLRFLDAGADPNYALPSGTTVLQASVASLKPRPRKRFSIVAQT